ncbi:MAG: substrate-binding domain-containing protein [Dysosmobacter sp.]
MSILALTAAGVQVEKLESAGRTGKGQAGIRMSPVAREFGDQIEVVFANNDDMALGAIDACLEAEMDPLPFIVGVDATAPALEAGAAGTLQGTVLNDARGRRRNPGSELCPGGGNGAAVEDGHYVWLEYSAVTRGRWKLAAAGAEGQGE